MQAKTIHRNLILLTLLVLCCISVCQGDQTDDVYKKYLNNIMTGYNPEQNDLSWVTPDIKPVIIEKALMAYGSSDPTTHSNALEALIILGDKQTIEAYIADYHQGKTGIMPSIQVLPYLIDDLYHGDTTTEPKEPGSDMTRLSLMDRSTDTMYQILAVYPFFPQETREWAKSGRLMASRGSGPKSAANQMMRAWWEHNKDAVLAHQYGDAQWLPPRQNPVPPGPANSRQLSTPDAINTTPRISALTQVQPAVKTSLPWGIYASIVLSLGVIGGLWYFFRPQK